MGTHPIFESDFDCLTDESVDWIYILLHLFYKLYLLLLRTWKRINIFSYKKIPSCLSPAHVALVPSSYSSCSASNLKDISLWLRQRGAKKISIWDPENRLSKHNMNWDELNCRLVSSKELITISIQKMEQMDISYNSLTNDILDQLIGPNGDEPQILLSVGSNNLVNTDGYPPWALRWTSMYPFPQPYSDYNLNQILYKYRTVNQNYGK